MFPALRVAFNCHSRVAPRSFQRNTHAICCCLCCSKSLLPTHCPPTLMPSCSELATVLRPSLAPPFQVVCKVQHVQHMGSTFVPIIRLPMPCCLYRKLATVLPSNNGRRGQVAVPLLQQQQCRSHHAATRQSFRRPQRTRGKQLSTPHTYTKKWAAERQFWMRAQRKKRSRKKPQGKREPVIQSVSEQEAPPFRYPWVGGATHSPH